ncbi:bifunctional riboflavin kinase/FAD synthetase [Paenibacillus tundrae]|uniref:Riboflavin biosynthesis protein n=1 Tax=Paenibacillus tundrae TaxID=528187 RepID=A0ABT9WAX2_9BACL|nr:bifunctional riboflavin kinase/FAD synthetase [Paenibacillus tundrae]MDQ0169980.1 riboflavin kinase/FMN adenylyltransferase [Paenibacillus tundrae]
MKTVMLTYPQTLTSDELHTQPQVLAIGQFDGLHLGHASVILSAVRIARETGVQAAVMTFHPHPKEVMRKGDYEGYLTPLQDKEEILAGLGVDILYVVEFNDEFSKLTPEQFAHDLLLPLQTRTAVVGFDFRFGHQGAGDEQLLRSLGGNDMTVETVPPFLLNGEKVSSSLIRGLLKHGQMDEASQWLGRPYSIRGTVVHGEKRGRTIGFPTANLELLDRYVIPAKGVYAVRVQYGEQMLRGVMNLGVKPTFHESGMKPTFEVHLLDFEGQLYDQELKVELVHYIREERKFASIDALISQIREDALTAARLLS